MSRTYYEVLDVSETASRDAIKSAYRRKAQELHPDKVAAHIQGLPVSAAKRMKEVFESDFRDITEAYSVLYNTSKRKEYDDLLAQLRASSVRFQQAPPPPPPPQAPRSSRPSPASTTPPTPPPVPPVRSTISSALYCAGRGIGRAWNWLRAEPYAPAKVTFGAVGLTIILAVIIGSISDTGTVKVAPKVSIPEKQGVHAVQFYQNGAEHKDIKVSSVHAWTPGSPKDCMFLTAIPPKEMMCDSQLNDYRTDVVIATVYLDSKSESALSTASTSQWGIRVSCNMSGVSKIQCAYNDADLIPTTPKPKEEAQHETPKTQNVQQATNGDTGTRYCWQTEEPCRLPSLYVSGNLTPNSHAALRGVAKESGWKGTADLVLKVLDNSNSTSWTLWINGTKVADGNWKSHRDEDEKVGVSKIISTIMEYETSEATSDATSRKTVSTTLRRGGMRIRFDPGVYEDTQAELLKVLEDNVQEESLKDPNFSIQFWSDDGLFITYEVRYKGKVTNSSMKIVLSPMQFEREIRERW